MWETICDAQAGFWLNSKFLSKFSRKPFSGISDQKAPSPPWKTSDLGWPKFTPKYPPPKLKNFRFGMTKVYSEIPPQWKTSDLRWPKLLRNTPPNWKTSDLGWPKLLQNTPPNWKTSDTKCTPKYPPTEKLQIWDDQSVLRNTPNLQKFQIWDDQSLLWNDLGWPKFTLEYTPLPNRLAIREIVCGD